MGYAELLDLWCFSYYTSIEHRSHSVFCPLERVDVARAFAAVLNVSLAGWLALSCSEGWQGSVTLNCHSLLLQLLQAPLVPPHSPARGSDPPDGWTANFLTPGASLFLIFFSGVKGLLPVTQTNVSIWGK